MKYIFLDIDGVMNHSNHFKRSDKHELQSFCPLATKHLQRIVETCNAKIVVSSTWRKMYKTVGKLKSELFVHYDLQNAVVGLTPVIEDPQNMYYSVRGIEIRDYMKKHGIQVEDMIIIDDDDDMEDLVHRLIQTDWHHGGLTREKADEAIRLLKGEN